jgi:hypothetical protein
VAFATVKLRWTAGAGAKLLLPAWFAVTVTDPAPVIVNIEPETDAGPLTVWVTGRPEEAVAPSVIGATPYVTPGRTPKVIVWLAWVDETVTVTAVEVDAG